MQKKIIRCIRCKGILPKLGHCNVSSCGFHDYRTIKGLYGFHCAGAWIEVYPYKGFTRIYPTYHTDTFFDIDKVISPTFDDVELVEKWKLLA